MIGGVAGNAARTAAMIRAQRIVGGKQRRRKIPRQAEPLHIAKDYGRALALLVSRAVMREAFADLLRELPTLLDSARRERGDGERLDADEGKRARELIDTAKARLRDAVSTKKIEDLAGKFAEQTSTFQRIQLNRQTKAALGADVFTGDRGLRAKVGGFAAENVALIRDIPDTITARVEKTVTRALTSGTLHTDLAKTLESEFGYGEKRAQLIARDQVGKLYGQINAARQKELGVNKFRWRTVGDERVRGDPAGKYPDADSSHYDLDGEVFSYDDPPRDEDGNPMLPGEPILCRCTAEPVFDDLLGEVDG